MGNVRCRSRTPSHLEQFWLLRSKIDNNVASWLYRKVIEIVAIAILNFYKHVLIDDPLRKLAAISQSRLTLACPIRSTKASVGSTNSSCPEFELQSEIDEFSTGNALLFSEVQYTSQSAESPRCSYSAWKQERLSTFKPSFGLMTTWFFTLHTQEAFFELAALLRRNPYEGDVLIQSSCQDVQSLKKQKFQTVLEPKKCPILHIARRLQHNALLVY